MMTKLESLRAQLPALARGAFLNTGSWGPLSVAVERAMQEAVAAQVAQGRYLPGQDEMMAEQESETRTAVARLLGCAPDEIALTRSTTEAMNTAIWGLNWQPGDELLTTDLEHPGILLPAYTVRDRLGVTVKIADLIGVPPAETVARLEAAVTPRTRLLAISHVAWNTGALLPLREITAMAHRHGVLVLVDGAQSFASVPVNVAELGVDFYGVPGQKWLCGPDATGALYVRRSVLSQVRPTYAGWNTVAAAGLRSGYVTRDTAGRFEHATFQPADTAGFLAALRWFAEEVGPDWAYDRIHSLAGYARERLGAVSGVEVLTPAAHGGLVAIRVAGKSPDALAEQLAARGLFVRAVASTQALRIATGFYNTDAEIDAVAEALAGQPGAPYRP